jgi:hypothetical protein
MKTILLYLVSIVAVVYAFYLRITTGSAGGFTFLGLLGAVYLMTSLIWMYRDRKL